MSYQDALSNLMPIDWMDPYGRTPFAQGAEMSVDITIVETEDGIKASSVKNPPKAGPSRMMQAIKQALGIDLINNEPLCGSQQADDQGKQDDMMDNDNKEKSDIMEPSSSGGSRDRDRNPGSQGSRPGSPDLRAEKENEDAKEKAPK